MSKNPKELFSKIDEKKRERIMFDSTVKLANEGAKDIGKMAQDMAEETIYFAKIIKAYEKALFNILRLENHGDEWDAANLFDKAQRIADKVISDKENYKI